ncbi:MAG: hypothetical protein QXU18_14990, partial [Thermoplasmatales archaeon]
FLSFAYDEAYYFQFFRWVYLYGVQPYFLWTFGSFYNAMNIASLSFNIPFYFFGLDNVLVQQFTVKIPMIISAVLTGYGVKNVLGSLKPNKRFGNTPALLFLLLPITIFDVVMFGNPLIVSLMFLLISIVFLSRSKIGISALFLGASAATYLYPIFFVLPFIKVVDKNYGSSRALNALFLFIVSFFIGQFIPLVLSLLTGIPISLTILAPFFGYHSSVTVTANIPSMWSPYYIPYVILGVNTSATLKEIVFIITMSIPVIVFLLRKDNATLDKYVEFLFLESLVFVIFAITADPQYLLAIAPFAVLLYYLRKDAFYVTSLTVAFILDAVLFFTVNPLFYFFSNLFPSWGYAYKITFPPLFPAIFSIIYIGFLFTILGFHLQSTGKEKKSVIVKRNLKKNVIRRWNQAAPGFFVKQGAIGLAFLLVVTIVLAAPAITDAPKLMYFTPQASSGSSEAILYERGNYSTSYYIKAPVTWSVVNSYARENGAYYIEVPPGSVGSAPAELPTPFAEPVNSSFFVYITASIDPVRVGQPVTFYSHVSGGMPPYNYSWYGGGNQHTENETSEFYSPGNWSVEVVVTDSVGAKAVANYTETVLYDYYIYFNSHFLGGYISSTSHTIALNPLYIKEMNFLNFSGNFSSNSPIILYYELPLTVPPWEIFENWPYLLLGVSFLALNILGLLYVLKELNGKQQRK